MSETLTHIIKQLGGNIHDIPPIIDQWFIKRLIDYADTPPDVSDKDALDAYTALGMLLQLPPWHHLIRDYVNALTQERAGKNALTALRIVALETLLSPTDPDTKLELALKGAGDDGWQQVGPPEVRRRCEVILKYFKITATKAKELYLLQYLFFLTVDDMAKHDMAKQLAYNFLKMPTQEYNTQLLQLHSEKPKRLPSKPLIAHAPDDYLRF